MDKILQAIEGFSVTLGEFKSSVSKVLKEISDKKEELNLIKVAQDARTEGLNAREKEIKKIEDLVKLKEDTQVLLNNTETATRELVKTQKLFNENVIKQNKEIADNHIKNEHERLKNENNTKALIKAREELEAEKANFKLKFGQGLINLADKV